MLNKVMLIGRLGRDPEVRYMKNGDPVANLNVATDESYTDRDGNKVDKTEWHRVTVYGRNAENCANYLGKGSLVYVEGSLQTRKWQDQQGQDRYSTDVRAQRVQFLDRRGERGQAPDTGWGGAPYPSEPQQNRRPQQSAQDDYYQPPEAGPAHPAEGGYDNSRNVNQNRTPPQQERHREPEVDDPPFEAKGSESGMDEVPF